MGGFHQLHSVKNPRLGRRLVAILALMLLPIQVGLSGCAGSDREISEGHWRLELSDDWTAIQPSHGEAWTVAYRREGLILEISGEFDDDSIYGREVIASLDIYATGGLDNYHLESVRDVDIPDAYDAALARLSFTRDGEPQQGAWIGAGQWPYPSGAAIFLSGPKVSQLDVAEILEGLEFEQLEA